MHAHTHAHTPGISRDAVVAARSTVASAAPRAAPAASSRGVRVRVGSRLRGGRLLQRIAIVSGIRWLAPEHLPLKPEP
jgi:hypothetical protein